MSPGTPSRTAASLPLLLVLAVAVWTAILPGCPAPTGHTRGRIPDANIASCPGDARPNPGEPCQVGTDYCEFTQPCAGGGERAVTCACSFTGTWTCQFQRCERDTGPEDAASGCPIDTFWSGYACTQAQMGITCPGNVLGCDGGVAQIPCTCGAPDYRWVCPLSCVDGGRRDAGHTDAARDALGDVAVVCPAEPAPGDRCLPGLECAYPGPCPAYCTCPSEGVFQCDIGACTDAGVDAHGDVGAREASVGDTGTDDASADDAGGDDADASADDVGGDDADASADDAGIDP